MAQILVSHLAFTYPGSFEPLFEDVSFTLDSSWKLGFVGRNGRGKTTFLRLLMGDYPYQGTIQTTLSFAYFPFDIRDEGRSALDTVRAVIAPFDAWQHTLDTADPMSEAYQQAFDLFLTHDGYIIDELIAREAGLIGVEEEALSRPFSTLSGGERVKLLLAALFLRKNAFLLIDEPTNHLDDAGRAAVRDYLRKKSGYILVSHERSLLDACCDHILNLGNRRISLEQGNYATFHENQRRQEAWESARNAQLKRDIAQLENAAREREGWSNSLEKTKKAAGDSGFVSHKAAKLMQLSKNLERRQERAIAEKRELLQHVETAEPIKIVPEPYRTQRILELSKLSVDYGAGPLFAPVDLRIERGARVHLKARNGAGKSSLIRLIMGEDVPHTGEIRRARDVLISYVPQDTSHLRGSLTDFADAQGVERPLLLSMLRKLDFSRTLFEFPMETYSAGQKKKALLAVSLCQRAHLYIWDEPLNFIDILSREQIEEAVLASGMTLLFVEHDESFSTRIATGTVELLR